MKRNILITGIYGFIGANFAIYWNNHYPDDRIIGIDKMTYAANPANLDSIARHANMTCYRGDIADAAFVQSVFEKERPQWVVNLRQKVMWTARLTIRNCLFTPMSLGFLC